MTRLNWVKSHMLAAAVASVATLAGPFAFADDVNQDRLLNADKEAGNWLHHHKNYSATRFSSLADINKDNVKNLKVAWTMALGGVEGGGIWAHGGLEGTPIVENGFMYVTDGWGSVYKIDAHGGKGVLLWKMDPKTDHDWAGAVACCGVDNRGVALWNNLVISHTLDGRLIATNKETGQVAWQRQVADPDKGEVITGAPLIVKDMAITGVAGAEYGIRGWIAATDLKSQKEVWRTHTIPGKDEPGHETWKDDKNAKASGGGSTWVTGSYDPATNTIVWGVGNPGPDWDNEYRPGDNLYTDSLVSLDLDTGKIACHFQYIAHDVWDLDAVSPPVLVNVADKNGKTIPGVIHAGKTGHIYVHNRKDCSLIRFSEAMVPQENMWTLPTKEGARMLPGANGGVEWSPIATDPGQNLAYAINLNQPMHYRVESSPYPNGKLWLGGAFTAIPGEKQSGNITAVNYDTGKIKWQVKTPEPMIGGILATAGGLVFAGEGNGKFAAYNSSSGKELWSFHAGAGVNAPPSSYMVGGKQYIVVGAGGNTQVNFRRGNNIIAFTLD